MISLEGAYKILLTGLLFWSSMLHEVCGTTEESIISSIQSAYAFLQETRQLLREAEVGPRLDEIRNEIAGLSSLQNGMERMEKDIDELILLANVRQVEGLISRLNETLQQELALRFTVDQLNQLSEATNANDTGSRSQVSVEETMEYVNIHELKGKLAVSKVMEQSEKELKEWILDSVKRELEAFKATTLAPPSTIETDQIKKGPTSPGSSCLTPAKAVQDIQVALTKYSQDSIGFADHAQGAEIVHSMTSPTYEPPPRERERLGNIWWRKYIPEDWEILLPNGWKDWDVGLPSIVYHSFNLQGARVAPPEAILGKKVLPGACWAMKGSEGYVTIRLPYPIKVDSFSLDHVLVDILPGIAYGTAPKVLKVIAYPPCLESKACSALGFDIDSPMQIAEMVYDIDGPSTQTFKSIFITEDSATLDSDIESNAGACPQGETVCSTPRSVNVAAITLKIMENYGSSDYTCLYRFRVHGEPLL